MTSLIEMDCSKDNLAIYNEYAAYVFKANQFEVISPEKKQLGENGFTFRIKLDTMPFVLDFINPRISICLSGKEYIGRGSPKYSSNLPAACHFFFKYDEHGKINVVDEKYLICFSTKYLSLEDYAKEVLGIQKK
jgi:hypothetical protein